MRRLLRGLGEVLRGFYEDQGFFLAAGISFYLIICILPFLLLLVSLLGYLLVSSEEATGQIVLRIVGELPVYQEEIEKLLTEVVLTRKTVGVFGTIILLLFSSQLCAAVRVALSRIFRIRSRRGFLRGILEPTFHTLLLGLLLLVNMGATALLTWIEAYAAMSPGSGLVGRGFQWVGTALALGLTAAMFLLIYRMASSRGISLRSAAIGALSTALLWEVARWLFRWYISGLGVYSTLYGSVGVLVAVIMWVYYSAVVFLLGAELVRVCEGISREQ